jgi:hypothetical protein
MLQHRKHVCMCLPNSESDDEFICFLPYGHLFLFCIWCPHWIMVDFRFDCPVAATAGRRLNVYMASTKILLVDGE